MGRAEFFEYLAGALGAKVEPLQLKDQPGYEGLPEYWRDIAGLENQAALSCVNQYWKPLASGEVPVWTRRLSETLHGVYAANLYTSERDTPELVLLYCLKDGSGPQPFRAWIGCLPCPASSAEYWLNFRTRCAIFTKTSMMGLRSIRGLGASDYDVLSISGRRQTSEASMTTSIFLMAMTTSCTYLSLNGPSWTS
ncbi:hypothetical protein MAUB_16140 [Mycolicibacterium aubagnense]|uniref:Uncharacterized protein n=1 Tax=Mycolicibacterium aubagnense TaxID=319707 RepID=A0ABM7IAS0_9MYCO|nr:hypothetical protein MAUB_16140 [Mycolicibacterium aubagnense]